jgi:hypothetical protein
MRLFFAFVAFVAVAIVLSVAPAVAVDVPIGSTNVDLVDGPFDATGELLATVDRSITFTESGSAEVWGTGTVTSNVFRQAAGNLLFQYTVHDVDFPDHDTSQWNLLSVSLSDFGTFATDVRGDSTGLVAARTDGNLFISTSDQIHNDHDIMIRTDATDFDQNGQLSIATTVIEPVFGSPSASASGLFQPVVGDGAVEAAVVAERRSRCRRRRRRARCCSAWPAPPALGRGVVVSGNEVQLSRRRRRRIAVRVNAPIAAATPTAGSGTTV